MFEDALLCASKEPVTSSFIVATDRYIDLIGLRRGTLVCAHPDRITTAETLIIISMLTAHPVVQTANWRIEKKQAR